MARYIDADAAVEEARLAYCKDCNSYNGVMCRACAFDDAMSFIEDYPAADVAPKSEVEKWKEINEQLYKELSERMIEERKIVRKLVARLIFADLEAKAPWFCENQTAYEHFNEELAEIKKKYTEDQT